MGAREISDSVFILKGQRWAPRWDYYNRHVVIDDEGDGKVMFHYIHDPSLKFFLPEDEFLSEYDYVPPRDE